jgi:alkylation response protein AidB-like acyl-CoA dehydrogenase
MPSLFFNEEHDILRRHIRKFVEAEIAPHADEWEKARDFPNSVFRRLGELGLLGLRYPEEYGGQGGDLFASIVLTEELSRGQASGLPTAVAVHTEMAMPVMLQFGTEEQKRRFLVPGISGEKVFALAMTEPDAGSDLSAIQTKSVPEGGVDPASPEAVAAGTHWIINGAKLYITNGCRADGVVTAVRTGPDKWAGITLFLIEKGTPGYTVAKKLDKVGLWSSDTAELVFEDCRVPSANILGQVNHGFFHLMWELQGERIISSAAAVAAGDRALELALKFVNERSAFGKPIGKFQALRHRLADMATDLEAARQLVYTTAWRIQQGEQVLKEVSMCKLFAAQMAFRVADEALQMHGGAGYMEEYLVSRVWRDCRSLRIAAGTDEIMREIIAKQLGL